MLLICRRVDVADRCPDILQIMTAIPGGVWRSSSFRNGEHMRYDNRPLALRLLASVALLELCLASTAQAAGATVPKPVIAKPVVVNGEVLPEVVVGTEGSGETLLLGAGDPSAVGVVVLDESQVQARSDSTGDANAVLKTLPNVQWRTDATDDGGTSLARELDLKPTEVSISGARITENNFLLDGVEINRIAGTSGDARATLEDDTLLPVVDSAYGGHSQSIFVSPSLIESVTVQDSGVSAEYGRFQGGVVNYKTRDPFKDRVHAGFDVGYTGSELATFNLATEDGENPNDREAPEFYKDQENLWLSGPINEKWAALVAYGRQHAFGEKQRASQYVDQSKVETESFSETFMGKVKGETEIGTLTLQSIYAPYTEDWESAGALQSGTSILGDGWSNALTFQRDLGTLGAFENSRVEAIASLNMSESGRDGESNTATFITISQPSKGYSTTAFDECVGDPTAYLTSCRIGGYGDLLESQTDYGLKLKGSAGLFGHEVKVGGSVTRFDLARERPEDVTLYGASTISATPNVYTCDDPNDPLCTGDQFARTRSTWLAYRTEASVTQFDLYGEMDFDFNRLDLKTGLRLDYDDYQQNVNLSPRVSASLDVMKDVVLTGGGGRYYTNSMLEYAIRDGIPKGFTSTRSAVGGVVYNTEGGNGWSAATSTSSSLNSARGLDTPYTDEIFAGVTVVDPLLGGTFRLKGLHRKGRDQFASSTGTYSMTGTNVLTNDGWSEYSSASLEYGKFWDGLDFGALSGFGLSGSVTWAKSRVSDDSYVPTDEETDYILYNGQSYTDESFTTVRGNLDIPVRLTLTVDGSLWEDRVRLWSNAEFSLAYDGVRDTGSETTFNGLRHDIYEDYRYSANVVVNMGGTLRVAETKYGAADLTVKVDNVFNHIGNKNADDDYPFKKGRVFWAGMSYQF